MRKTIIEKYEAGLFRLVIEAGHKYFFEVSEENMFERTQDQVLAIMECQHEILGDLIKIVKKGATK